jgi:uncharacterized protein YdaU (DUF1376 family)
VINSEGIETGGDSVIQTEPRPDPQPSREVDEAMPQRTTAPAFQFYPKDFLSSSKVSRMSMTERGIYITLLSYAWLDGSLPSDLGDLAKIVGMRADRFERIWKAGPLQECFICRQTRVYNERLEIERKKQQEFRRRQSDNGKLGGRPKVESGGLGLGSSGLSQTKPKKSSASAICNLQSAISNKKKEKDSLEPHGDSTPVVMNFPVVGNPEQVEWALHQSRVDAWRVAYPNLDIVSECRKAEVWTRANPERRKTAKGMPAFLVKWLNRQTDNARQPFGGTSSAGKPMPKWYQDVQARKAAQP